MLIWTIVILLIAILLCYMYVSYRLNLSNDILLDIRRYNMRENKNIVKNKYNYKNMLEEDGKCMILTSLPIDFSSILNLFETRENIHYICWSQVQYPLEKLVENSRDTFITVLYNQPSFSKNFAIFQKSRFTLEFLHYMIAHPNDWNQVLSQIGLNLRTSISNPYYTYFFTIYYDEISLQRNEKFELTDRLTITSSPLLFQTWVSHFTNNNYLFNCYSQLQLIYPNYPYKLFSDYEMKQFIRQYYDSNIISQYDNIIPSAFKSDFFRYLFLYKMGGLYMDMTLQACEDVIMYIRDRYGDVDFVSATDNGHKTRLWNAFMYVKAGHPFMRYCIDKIMGLKKSLVKECLNYTGPGLLGEAVNVLGRENSNYILFQFRYGEHLIDPRTNVILFTPKAYSTSHKKITKDMYKESNKSHYSVHCLYNRIFYY